MGARARILRDECDSTGDEEAGGRKAGRRLAKRDWRSEPRGRDSRAPRRSNQIASPSAFSAPA